MVFYTLNEDKESVLILLQMVIYVKTAVFTNSNCKP